MALLFSSVSIAANTYEFGHDFSFGNTVSAFDSACVSIPEVGALAVEAMNAVAYMSYTDWEFTAAHTGSGQPNSDFASQYDVRHMVVTSPTYGYPEFIGLQMTVAAGGGTCAAPPGSGDMANVEAKLDTLIALLSGAVGSDSPLAPGMTDPVTDYPIALIMVGMGCFIMFGFGWNAARLPS